MIPLTELNQEEMIDRCAVIVRGACKHYGGKSDGVMVLDHLDMTVTKGTIYGLLGASGCGKTTLLSCVVGTKTLDSGNILVLGENSSAIKSWNMAPRVGYMPQENALVAEFNVKESVYYFGWLYGMTGKEVDESYSVLSALLDLPPDKQLVRNLSGGQMRRVSLASTLIHNPELLILDEPTVGLDPVLRQGTWNHFCNLAKRGTTIIITTHYIEEARQAHRIGLMRGGKLLAEDSPEHLISMCRCPTLEDVFLLLSSGKALLHNADALSCSQSSLLSDSSELVTNRHFNSSTEVLVRNSQEEASATSNSPFVSDSTGSETKGHFESPNETFEEKNSHNFALKSSSQHTKSRFSYKLRMMYALLYKNTIKVLRHPGSVFFIFLFPFLQTSAFFLAVGRIPQGLKVAVVNDELGNFSNCDDMLRYLPHNITILENDECLFSDLGCLFLDSIEDSFTEKVYYTDLKEALEELQKGRVIGVVHMSMNFTSSFKQRFELANYVNDDVFQDSEIQVFVDSSDKQLSDIVKLKYFDAFVNFSETIITSCGHPIKLAHIPMDFEAPVYGDKHPSYKDFMIPGVLISIMYFLSAALSSAILIHEKMERIWDRTLVSGVTEVEMFFSHFITQTVQMAMQLFTVLIISIYLFHIPVPEHMILAVLLIALQGFTGMTFGFLMSAMCTDIRTSNYITMGIFMPYTLLSGYIWPLQGMPQFLQYISYLSPATLPNEGLRSIIFRNWDLREFNVVLGFLTSAVWIIVQIIACIFIVRYKK